MKNLRESAFRAARLFLVPFCWTIMSCGFGPGDTVFAHALVICCPDMPKAWEGMAVDFFDISWTDEKGEERSARLAPGETLRIRVPRGRKQAILASPRRGGTAFRPAGIMYPASVTKDYRNKSEKYDMLKLTFYEGYVACVAKCLENAGLYPYEYKLDKLLATEFPDLRDPWSVAPWEAAVAFAEGKFRAGLYPEAKLKVRLPSGCPWWPESPFARVEAEAGTGTMVATLATGIHTFHSEGDSLLVSVADGKTIFQIVGRE